MTRYINSDFNQYIPANTSSKVLHTGPGKIRAIIATPSTANAETLTLYDNTAASGNILIKINCSYRLPTIIILPQNFPMVFSTGLTAVTSVGLDAFVITEA